ncbi:energy transducer TonB [candidate division KSB1 bacterium]
MTAFSVFLLTLIGIIGFLITCGKSEKAVKTDIAYETPILIPPELRGGMDSIYAKIVYPREAVKNKIEGTTYVKVTVDESGKPEKVEVQKSSGNKSLDDAAVKAVWAGAGYSPAIQGGKPVKFRMVHPIHFNLTDELKVKHVWLAQQELREKLKEGKDISGSPTIEVNKLKAEIKKLNSLISGRTESSIQEIPTFLPIEDQPKLIGGMKAIYEKLVYPEEAIKAKIEGKVTVRVLVGKTGMLEEIEVVNSSGSRILDDAAVKACFMGAKYVPAKQEGEPVRFRTTHRIIFKLTDDKKEKESVKTNQLYPIEKIEDVLNRIEIPAGVSVDELDDAEFYRFNLKPIKMENSSILYLRNLQETKNLMIL